MWSKGWVISNDKNHTIDDAICLRSCCLSSRSVFGKALWCWRTPPTHKFTQPKPFNVIIVSCSSQINILFSFYRHRWKDLQSSEVAIKTLRLHNVWICNLQWLFTISSPFHLCSQTLIITCWPFPCSLFSIRRALRTRCHVWCGKKLPIGIFFFDQNANVQID